MLEKYGKIFEVTYELAKKRHDALSVKPGAAEGPAYGQAGRELEDFLSCLDIETLKILQVVMYIGRDHEAHGNLKPDRILSDYRRHYCVSWLSKEAEMKPLTDSYALDGYIKKGLEILEIWNG
jgi:hypothetical protein